MLNHWRRPLKSGSPQSVLSGLLLFLLALPSPAVNESKPKPCKTNSPAPASQLMHRLVEVAKWTGDPAIALNQVVGSLGPQVKTLFAPRPWPEINERARQAKVPVMMYHDILPKKDVFFDVTPVEFEQHLRLIQKNGLTPISFDQLVTHLQTGLPLPEKPILLTFDDGYRGHYQYVYPLLQKYGYPGLFSIYTKKIGATAGRPGLTWEELKEMAVDPLVTISAHSISHPENLTLLADDQLKKEIIEPKSILEKELGITIRYFTYPTGFYDERVAKLVTDAGYQSAMTMDDLREGFAGESGGNQTLWAITAPGDDSASYRRRQATPVVFWIQFSSSDRY
jgi:poly-beta-1,6-N-acetyl-D-glucosamine N-deacetylase